MIIHTMVLRLRSVTAIIGALEEVPRLAITGG